MEKQNITLSLPKDLLRKAKLMAARNHLSLSEFMRQLLEEEVMKESGYRAAKNRHLKMLRQGLDLGTKGKIAFSREELYSGRPTDKLVLYEGDQTRIPLKDTVQFVGDIVSPKIRKARKASR
jgi:hypothetical protein